MRIYTTPLPDGQATTSDEGVRARIQQAGLLQDGGTATEKISAENIDLVVSGKINLGSKFSAKIADEIESLGESEYSGLPYFNPELSGGGRNKGYYELERVDVNPVHPVNEDVFEYTAAFTFTSTRQDDWRAVETKEESISTGLATGSSSDMGIPARASKTKWYDAENGKEEATRVDTVAGEFEDIALFDPDDATGVNPMLLYEIDYADESPVDVRVYDTRGLSKYYTVNGEDFSQWTHAYHTSFEYEGNPLVDNGRHRLEYDETNGEVDLSQWDETLYTKVDSTTDWSSGSNATLSTTTDNTWDGTAVRADTDASGTTGNRDATYNPSGTTDMSAADSIKFYYYTDNAGGTHSLTITDGSATSDTVDFSGDVTADSGGFITVALSGFTNDLSTVDSIQWVFDGPSGEDKYIIVDSVRYGDLAWNTQSVSHSSFSLVDVDFTSIGPADTRTYCEFVDDSSGTIYEAIISHQRGLNEPIARGPEGETWTSAFETYLDQFCSNATTDVKPTHGLKPRTEVR